MFNGISAVVGVSSILLSLFYADFAFFDGIIAVAGFPVVSGVDVVTIPAVSYGCFGYICEF